MRDELNRKCIVCGADISGRHGAAKYCVPCGNKGIRPNGKNYNDKARLITKYAVEIGFLSHPEHLVCVDCGVPAKCYDHRDYTQPLLVDPVCSGCNNRRGAGIPLIKLPFIEPTLNS
jgi:hypothetical protein